MLFVQKISGYCLESVEFTCVSKSFRLHSIDHLGKLIAYLKKSEKEGWYFFTVESELLGSGMDVSKSNSTT